MPGAEIRAITNLVQAGAARVRSRPHIAMRQIDRRRIAREGRRSCAAGACEECGLLCNRSKTDGLYRFLSRRDPFQYLGIGALYATALAFDSLFTPPVFLRKMAFSHAAPSPENRCFVRLGLAEHCSNRRPPVRAPINMTDQNRASASSVPYRLFDPVR